LRRVVRPSSHRPPAPFVVGAPRSGTTLLRLMLDMHDDLAIPPETGFGFLIGEPGHALTDPGAFLRAASALPTWSDLPLEERDLRARLDAVRPWSVAGGLRAVYGSYAALHGKPRWGDKTPVHARYMSAFAALLPEARFVHLIRDGRDVAVSIRDLPFSPGGIEAIAAEWRDAILGARRQAPALPHYREVRYEELVQEPERVLRELCAYLELDYQPAMLRAHERAASRHAELPPQRPGVGGAPVTREERARWHDLTRRPPDPSRVGRWRDELTGEERERFERVAGGLLAELGYGAGARTRA
jgi:hypothetical protein